MQPPTLRNLDPYNARSYDLEAPFAERRYEYLVARRDQANDRLRTGSLALNGSSIVAMLATLSGDGTAARWIGLNESNTALTAAFFVVGAALAGASLVLTTGLFATESSDAFNRMLAARRVAASYEVEDTQESRIRAVDALVEMHATPQVDFRYSRASIVTQSMGAGAWLAGMCIPITTALDIWGKLGAAWSAVTGFI